MISTSVILALGAAMAVSAQEMPTAYSNPLLAKVLLYTYTDGFRHDSIPTAIKQLQAWGPYYNVSFDATEDQTKINTANLAQYDTILCVHSTGNIFSTAGQAAFVDYLSKGGNFAAIHAASAGYLDKPWAPYTQTLGATFDHHPKRQNATFLKLAPHPATNPFPDSFVLEEEVYSFTSDPRKLGAKVLMTVDENSFKDSGYTAAQGTPQPIMWYQDYAAGAVVKSGSPGPGVAGRSFYSSLGHLNETWQNPTFMKHVLGGLTWTFASNTTRVAAGLYGGAEPTVHTGATNNATVAAANPWAPVLGSNATAPAPPPVPVSTQTASGSAPESTGTSGNTSGASSVKIGAGIWTVVLAVAGAFAL
ncbi:class I glutamine amidotransferase-like protein [Ceratobasidium sp. AG-I]|nr:class I glutamine amidotransferase-like protein [Ceratobasidium sp. AG-I]